MASRASADRSIELFAITPGRGDAGELREKIVALAAGGVTRVLLREKAFDPIARRRVGEVAAAACREGGIELWVSEEVALAQALGARGVHLSERSPAPSALAATAGDLRFGVSLHRPVLRQVAELRRCDHAFVAPLFATPGKPDDELLGVAGFTEVASALQLPAFALGGITLDHAPELAAVGIRRVAAIRLFFDARDPARAAATLRERLSDGCRG
ncbi:MAG: hypothetical protein EXS13_13815 [Planctomycetes bacterium]|nr:hypothetical protein [Planctomycetota bacterium]